MFEEINELRIKKGRQEGPQIDVEDSNTWADRNWPSSCKFLVDSVALHPQAFVNRCNPKIYEAFSGTGTVGCFLGVTNYDLGSIFIPTLL